MDITYQRNDELVVATVGPDRMFQPLADGNSLYLRDVNRPRIATRRVANYQDGDVHYPGFVHTPDGPMLVWTAVQGSKVLQSVLRAAYINEQNDSVCSK